ncbi:hypothetical protein SCOR_30770 [Sulfidibacter corallicola]
MSRSGSPLPHRHQLPGLFPGFRTSWIPYFFTGIQVPSGRFDLMVPSQPDLIVGVPIWIVGVPIVPNDRGCPNCPDRGCPNCPGSRASPRTPFSGRFIRKPGRIETRKRMASTDLMRGSLPHRHQLPGLFPGFRTSWTPYFFAGVQVPSGRFDLTAPSQPIPWKGLPRFTPPFERRNPPGDRRRRLETIGTPTVSASDGSLSISESLRWVAWCRSRPDGAGIAGPDLIPTAKNLYSPP